MSSKLVCILMTGFVVPCFVHANEFMDKKFYAAIEQQRKHADDTAEFLVASDLAQASLLTLSKLQAGSVAVEDLAKIRALSADLSRKFEQYLATGKGKSKIKDAKHLEQLNAAFQEMNKDLFSLTWRSVESKVRIQNLGEDLRQIGNAVTALCNQGRATADFEPLGQSTPAPPPIAYPWQFKWGPGNDISNSQNYYGAYGVGVDGDSRLRQRIAGIAGTASGLGYSVAAGVANGSLTVAAGTSGAWMSAGMAAGGVGAAVAAVTAAADYLITSKKELERQKRYTVAENYKFAKTKRSDYIAQRYREVCHDKAAFLISSINGVEKLVKGDRSELESARAELARESDWMATFEARSKKASDASCALDLADLYKENQCKGPDAGCTAVSSGGKTVIKNKFCEIPLLSNQTPEVLEKNLKIRSDFENDPETAEGNKKFLDLSLKSFFVNKYDGVLSDYKNAILNEAFTSRSQAFSRFLKLSSVYRKNGFSTQSLVPANAAVANDEEFLSLVKLYQAAITRKIQSALGKVKEREYRKALESFAAAAVKYGQTGKNSEDYKNLKAQAEKYLEIRL